MQTNLIGIDHYFRCKQIEAHDLKRILEETNEADGEAKVRERMQMLSSQLIDSISNLHEVFTSRIFVAICRGFRDKMGQVQRNVIFN